jgi:rhodanese-related sulfurtransferase/uncharacterized membrane protein YedE/YeeE
MGPFEWTGIAFVVVNLLLGMGFGVALERNGFGDSRRIAGQFMLTDLTVLKVMFTAIMVAMLLLFWSSALGVIDMDHVFIDETYLWPGILGGAMIGIGMVVGGYCPGTSIVATSTLKLDGLVFILGLFVGIFIFGENVPAFWDFFNESGAMGTYTLDQWLGTSPGLAAFYVTLLALAAFWGVHKFEKAQKGEDDHFSTSGRAATALSIAAGLGLVFVPQPGLQTKIERMGPELDASLAAREVQIDPAELVDLMHNNQVKLLLLDLRTEADFNMFHLLDAKHITLDDLRGDLPDTVDPISIIITMSNDEALATDAFRILRAQGLAGSYILEGGINEWLAVYGDASDVKPEPLTPATKGELEPMLFTFPAALGDRIEIAWPNPHHMHLPEREYEKKAKSMKPMALAGGGCG